MKYKLSAQASGIALLMMIPLMSKGSAVPQDTPRRINVVAKRFLFSPSEITLKNGEPVVLLVTSQDVVHGLKFKELDLDAEIKKGETGEIAFTPTKTGDFVGNCSHFCGAGHGSMTLTLHVTE
jgi:cytochrome c oxidase subunit 2